LGAPLHRLPGAPGPGRDLTRPSLVLLASPDDYLLELERSAREAAWTKDHPEGEAVRLTTAPPPHELVDELTSPSLFTSERLVVVRDARAYIGREERQRRDGASLASALEELSFSGVDLLLTAVSEAEPTGPLVDLVARRGEISFLALPAPPKPWEEAVVSGEQRRVLETVIRRVTPELLDHPDTVAALCEVHGFRPRELAQAAERLLLSGELTVEAVHGQAGLGERSLKEIEEALLHRDAGRASRFFGALTAGGDLRGWWGNIVGPEEFGRVLSGAVGRLLRNALAIRGHARSAGIMSELEPARCASRDWYPRKFRPQLLPKLEAEIKKADGSPLAKFSAWQLHRVFRVAAAYRDRDLLTALSRLGKGGVEIAGGGEALAAVGLVVVELISARAG